MKFNILQYLPNTTKIMIDKEIRKELFSNKSISEWSKSLNVPLKNISRYINGTRSIPITLLTELAKSKKINSKLQDKIKLKITKSGNYLRIGPIIKIDEDLIYVAELIKGDGHITPNFWRIIFVNNNGFLITYVHNFFKSLGIKQSQISLIKRKDANFLTIRSSLLAILFNKILEVPSGRKKELNIPEFVLSDRNLSIAAVRGAFDAEGHITSKGSRRISITSNSKKWLTQLKQILEKLNINSRIFEDKSKRKEPLYRLFISHRQNLIKFLKIIKPLHTKRKEKLKERLSDYTKNPQKEFHKRILLSIKKGNTRRREIASDIKQDLILIGNNINWLKKKRYIDSFEKIYTNKGCYHKYKVTGKGEGYLEKSLSFFD